MRSRTGTPEGSPTWPSPVWSLSSWYQELRDKRQDKKDRTFPKVTQRKRAISLLRKNGKASPTLQGNTAGQAQSIFFKLPAELRTTIYEEVVGKEIHIILVEASKGKQEIKSYKSLQWKNIAEHLWKFVPPDSSYPGVGVMGLLRSCRGVYVLKHKIG
jgi:hypothetical protein